jgi:hypothetical protein
VGRWPIDDYAKEPVVKAEKNADQDYVLTLTRAELRIFNNAMNETLEALGADEDEFATRVGASVQDVRDLLSEVNALLRKRD